MNAHKHLDTAKQTFDSKTADPRQCLIAASGEQSIVLKELQSHVRFWQPNLN